jgi:hypothetical protein
MASKIKVDQLETADGSGTIALQNQLSGMTYASLPTGSMVSYHTSILTSSNGVTFNSNDYADSGLSITLTPKSTSSKFEIIIHGASEMSNSSGISGQDHRLLRNSTMIVAGRWNEYMNPNWATSDFYPWFNLVHIDSPNTTSSITYKFQGRKYSGSQNSWNFGMNTGETGRAHMIIKEIL